MKGLASAVPSWNVKMIYLSEYAPADATKPSKVPLPHTIQHSNWIDRCDGHGWTRQALLQPATGPLKGRQRKPQIFTRCCVSTLAKDNSDRARKGPESGRASPAASESHVGETAPLTPQHCRQLESTNGSNLKVLAYTAIIVAASASAIFVAFTLAHG